MRRVWAGMLALALAAPAAAQEAGNAERGRNLAGMMCAGCHDIEPGGAFKEYPPSFAAIAAFRDRDQILSRIFFPPFHASMPAMGGMMMPQEVYDLAAYIQSLEGSVTP